MIILGVDPGSRLLGYGLIEKSGNSVRVVDHGTLRLFHKEYRDVPVDETTPSRLKEIHTGLSQLILKHRPTVMAVEKVFFLRVPGVTIRVDNDSGEVVIESAAGPKITLSSSGLKLEATQIEMQANGGSATLSATGFDAMGGALVTATHAAALASVFHDDAALEFAPAHEVHRHDLLTRNWVAPADLAPVASSRAEDAHVEEL